MDFHLERGLRLRTEPEDKTLYAWAINEIDLQGRQIGSDQIPWDWTLHFTATSCLLGDSINIDSQFQTNDASPPEVTQRQVIRARLRSGRLWDGNYYSETSFSMFGTARTIKSFQLEIHPIADPGEQERCVAWGSVSYTTEIDFTDETTDDCIVFYLFVKPETFARYGAKIAHGLIDEMILSVKSVAGFYSEWSTSASTGDIKVLTDGNEQKVALPPGHGVQLPRLGYVGVAELYINRRLEFHKRLPESEAVKGMPDSETEHAVPLMQSPGAVDLRILQVLDSLRQAAWLVICLLALILVVIFFRL